jgi:pimeloyl-ACP methyl ester carboxylesterase
MWAHQVEGLSAEHRTVNVDLRGHGASGPAEEPFTLYDLVDDALAVLDDQGIESAVWAGLSIGGMIGLRAALQAPERVRALALVDTDAGVENGFNRFKYRLLGWIARNLGLSLLRRPVAKQMFGATTLRTRRDLVALWTDLFLAAHVPSALRTLDALLARDDLRPRLPEITVPALVLVGEEDFSLPPVRSRALAAALPDASLVEVPAAGHLSAVEQPEVVTTALRDFLRRVTAGS